MHFGFFWWQLMRVSYQAKSGMTSKIIHSFINPFEFTDFRQNIYSKHDIILKWFCICTEEWVLN